MARGWSSRRRVGKVRHIATRFLWLQERIADKDLSIVSVPAAVHRADMLTKPMRPTGVEELLSPMGVEFAKCREAAQKSTLLEPRRCRSA